MSTPDAQNPAPLAVALQGGEEEFPVLKAFENYLEAERQKSRKRMIALTCIFSGVLLVVIVLFIVIGALLINRMFSQQERLLDHVVAQQRPLQQVQAPAPVAPAPVAIEKPAPEPVKAAEPEAPKAVEPRPEPEGKKPVEAVKPEPLPEPAVAPAAIEPIKPKPVIEIPKPPVKPEVPKIPPPKTPEGVVAQPIPDGLKIENRNIKTPNSPSISWQIWTR